MTKAIAATALASGVAAAATQPEGATPPADPFANIPTIKLHEAEVLDLSGMECSNPRKYAKAHASAVELKLPVMANWKHMLAIIQPGTTVKEFRAGSVFGTLVDIVKRAGKQGLPAYDLATQLRQGTMGNKRSHYCEKLQPVGWAEGYINSAIQQGLVQVHATRKASPLLAPATAPEGAAGTKAQPVQGAKATGTNG